MYYALTHITVYKNELIKLYYLTLRPRHGRLLPRTYIMLEINLFFYYAQYDITYLYIERIEWWIIVDETIDDFHFVCLGFESPKYSVPDN